MTTEQTAERTAKAEAITSLEPLVEKLMARHLEDRRLWMPSDFMPASEQMTDAQEKDLADLPDRVRGMPDAVRVSLALNLLTEEGLPHFHRLLAVYMGSEKRLVPLELHVDRRGRPPRRCVAQLRA